MYSATQVETVGEKYMAVSGVPETTEGHARWIAKLSLEIMRAARELNANPTQQMMVAVRKGHLNATRGIAVSVRGRRPNPPHPCFVP